MKKCPFCAEEILEAAIKCKHCGEGLVPGTAKEKKESASLTVKVLIGSALSILLPAAGTLGVGLATKFQERIYQEKDTWRSQVKATSESILTARKDFVAGVKAIRNPNAVDKSNRLDHLAFLGLLMQASEIEKLTEELHTILDQEPAQFPNTQTRPGGKNVIVPPCKEIEYIVGAALILQDEEIFRLLNFHYKNDPRLRQIVDEYPNKTAVAAFETAVVTFNTPASRPSDSPQALAFSERPQLIPNKSISEAVKSTIGNQGWCYIGWTGNKGQEWNTADVRSLAEFQNLPKGQEITFKADVLLRDPRVQPSNVSLGNQVGVIRPGQRVQVLTKVALKRDFGTVCWAQVIVEQPLSPEEESELKELVKAIGSTEADIRKAAVAKIIGTGVWKRSQGTVVNLLLSSASADSGNYFRIVNTLFLLNKSDSFVLTSRRERVEAFIKSAEKVQLTERNAQEYLLPVKVKLGAK